MNDLTERIMGAERELARAAVDRAVALHPDIVERWGPAGVAKCVDDLCFHLRYLCSALEADDPEEFDGYRAWAEQLFDAVGIPHAHLVAGFDALAAVLNERFGAEADAAVGMLEA